MRVSALDDDQAPSGGPASREPAASAANSSVTAGSWTVARGQDVMAGVKQPEGFRARTGPLMPGKGPEGTSSSTVAERVKILGVGKRWLLGAAARERARAHTHMVPRHVSIGGGSAAYPKIATRVWDDVGFIDQSTSGRATG